MGVSESIRSWEVRAGLWKPVASVKGQFGAGCGCGAVGRDQASTLCLRAKRENKAAQAGPGVGQTQNHRLREGQASNLTILPRAGSIRSLGTGWNSSSKRSWARSTLLSPGRKVFTPSPHTPHRKGKYEESMKGSRGLKQMCERESRVRDGEHQVSGVGGGGVSSSAEETEGSFVWRTLSTLASHLWVCCGALGTCRHSSLPLFSSLLCHG